MRFPKFSILSLLLLATACFDPQSKDNPSTLYVEESVVDIYVNGQLAQKVDGRYNVNVGDSLSVVADATDIDNSQLEFKFAFLSNNSRIVQDFSFANEIDDLIMTDLDVTRGSVIVVTIRGQDGIEHQHQETLIVSNGTSPASINSVDFYVNGILRDPYTYELQVGDVVSLDAHATDPNSLPLEYVFRLFNRCVGDRDLQSFSSSSSLYSFVVTNNEVNSCSGITVGVRNNDGINYDSYMFGDDQRGVPLKVQAVSLKPTVTSLDFYVNGVAADPYRSTLNVGDVITLTVNATEPNSLSLEYVFYFSRSSSIDLTLQAFSSPNTITYTVTSQDKYRVISILFGIRNNDGYDYESAMFGDYQFHIGGYFVR